MVITNYFGPREQSASTAKGTFVDFSNPKYRIFYHSHREMNEWLKTDPLQDGYHLKKNILICSNEDKDVGGVIDLFSDRDYTLCMLRWS